MKTYQEYLEIIKKREDEKWRKEYGKIHLRHIKEAEERAKDVNKYYLITPVCSCLDARSSSSKMSFDYSVEIMGLMMQDFLKEFKEKK